MHTLALLSLYSAFAYLCGSIAFGKLVGKRYGVDIQDVGSGNIGFANVLRSLGWQAGVLVLAGDVAKGFVPVWLAGRQLDYPLLAIVAIAALVGHIFPVWLKLKGGKGIATGLGVTLAMVPWLALLGAIIYVLTFLFVKKSALASLVATWSLPVACIIWLPNYAWFYFGLALAASWTHRANLTALTRRPKHAR